MQLTQITLLKIMWGNLPLEFLWLFPTRIRNCRETGGKSKNIISMFWNFCIFNIKMSLWQSVLIRQWPQGSLASPQVAWMEPNFIEGSTLSMHHFSLYRTNTCSQRTVTATESLFNLFLSWITRCFKCVSPNMRLQAAVYLLSEEETEMVPIKWLC